jgi:hypothetical protein
MSAPPPDPDLVSRQDCDDRHQNIRRIDLVIVTLVVGLIVLVIYAVRDNSQAEAKVEELEERLPSEFPPEKTTAQLTQLIDTTAEIKATTEKTAAKVGENALSIARMEVQVKDLRGRNQPPP